MEQEFTTDYEQILSHLQSTGDRKYSLTDVQFISLEGGQLELKVVTRFFVNAQVTVFDPTEFPPATEDRYGGANAICGTISGYGAWHEVENQVRAALPRGGLMFANAFWYNSEANNAVRYINGKFLFGKPNAMYYPFPAAKLSCVFAYMQDDFSQAIIDAIGDKFGTGGIVLGKGFRQLNVKNWSVNSSSSLMGVQIYSW
ncbi:MAG: hypothetical protein U5L96_20540 [Owenweeksia sp.]|nr:hypothetical protein [Owenweeksia sp.]